jgi:hypothetical protein
MNRTIKSAAVAFAALGVLTFGSGTASALSFGGGSTSGSGADSSSAPAMPNMNSTPAQIQAWNNYATERAVGDEKAAPHTGGDSHTSCSAQADWCDQ